MDLVSLAQRQLAGDMLVEGTCDIKIQEIIEEIKKRLSAFSLSILATPSISAVSGKVADIKEPGRGVFTLDGVNQMVEGPVYDLCVKWILYKLQEAQGAGIDPGDLNEVDQQHTRDIYNIVLDEAITSFFVICKSLGILDMSDSVVNNFEEENELKILDTSSQEVAAGLKDWQEKDESLTVEGFLEVTIEDKFYDDIHLRLDRQKLPEGGKRSFRIRSKIDSNGQEKLFYTLKRKRDMAKDKSLKENDLKAPRTCYEKEFEIIERELFQKLVSSIGLRNSRTKQKKRKSYNISFQYPNTQKKIVASLDIDTYDDIPEFVEIECESNEAIAYIIEKLGLKDKQQWTTGSRGLFRKYGKTDSYLKEYKVDDEGVVHWNNGEKGNLACNGVIY